MAQLKHRNVVSNFLFKEEDGAWLVALFRRSAQVRTYQGKLAPISGTIDEAERPFDAAVREIQEETKLKLDQDYELYLVGKPFNISDEQIGRSWTVHPLSWKLKDSTTSQFQIDWEHTGWSWTSPRAILEGALDQESVPNLAESLKRVWLIDSTIIEDWQQDGSQATTMLSQSLNALKNDHDSGASQMAGIALKCFRQIVKSFSPHRKHSKYWYQLQMIAWHIINNGRPSMNAAISRALLSILQVVKDQHEQDQIVAHIEESLVERTAVNGKISANFISYVDHLVKGRKSSTSAQDPSRVSILTLSASGTTKEALLSVFRHLPNLSIDLRIMESRPLCEGAQMATDLLRDISDSEKARLQITIATDASVNLLVQGTDLVLLGADRISEDGDVSNKTGSFAAAVCARAASHRSPAAKSPKVVVLSGTEKIAKKSKPDEQAEEYNSPEQIWRVWVSAGCKKNVDLLQRNENVAFMNVFFEWVPAEYIDSYITELGEMSTEQIRQQSAEIELLETALLDF